MSDLRDWTEAQQEEMRALIAEAQREIDGLRLIGEGRMAGIFDRLAASLARAMLDAAPEPRS